MQLCFEACTVALVLEGAETIRNCEAGASPPAIALKLIDEALNINPPAARTLSVTLAVSVTDAAVIEIVPLQVVPAVMLAGSTEIVKGLPTVPALKLPVGDRDSHVLPVQLCWEA